MKKYSDTQVELLAVSVAVAGFGIGCYAAEPILSLFSNNKTCIERYQEAQEELVVLQAKQQAASSDTLSVTNTTQNVIDFAIGAITTKTVSQANTYTDLIANKESALSGLHTSAIGDRLGAGVVFDAALIGGAFLCAVTCKAAKKYGSRLVQQVRHIAG